MRQEHLLTPHIVVRDNHLAAAVPEREGELSSNEGSLRGNKAYKKLTNILLSQNLLPIGRLHQTNHLMKTKQKLFPFFEN